MWLYVCFNHNQQIRWCIYMCWNHTENTFIANWKRHSHERDVRCDLNTQIVEQNNRFNTLILLETFYTCTADCAVVYCTPPQFQSKRRVIFTKRFLFILFTQANGSKTEKGIHQTNSVSFGLKEIVNSHIWHAHTRNWLFKISSFLFFFCHDQIEKTNTKMGSMDVMVLYVTPHAHRYIYRLFNVFLKYTFETLTASNLNDQSTWKSNSGIMSSSSAFKMRF